MLVFFSSVFPDRNLAYLKHGCLSRRSSREETKAKHYKQMIKEDRDASLLRMFDAFVESAPQLIIQIYLAIHDPPNETLHLGMKIQKIGKIVKQIPQYHNLLIIHFIHLNYY